MSAQRNVTSTMRSIYGTGNFNPRRFDRKQRKRAPVLYVWGIALFLFAIVAVVLGGMYLFGASPDSFTGSRVSFELVGDANPQTAENTEYLLRITNNEEVAIENLELFVDWPDSATDPEQGIAHFISSTKQAKSEANNTWELGEINAGESVDFPFTIRFAGGSGAIVSIPFVATFTPKTFSSSYTVTHTEEFALGDPTIAINITAPTRAAVGSEVLLQFRVSGDSLEREDKEKLSLALEIPKQLSINSTNPEQKNSDEFVWLLSDINQEKGVFAVSAVGTIKADIGQKLIIGAQLTREGSDEPLITGTQEISVQNASVAVSITGKPASGQKLQWGERIDYQVTLENTGTYVMRDVVVRMQMPNESLWQSNSLAVANSGFYESGNVFWDSATTSALDSLRPSGDTGLSLSFSTSERPPRGFAGVPRLVAGVEVTASLGDQEVSVYSEEHVINILADVDFNIQGFYTSPEGAIIGSGPYPPQQGQETVFVIQWNIGPTTSGLRDLELSARLPNSVSWKDDTSLAVGEISFSGSDRMVTWKSSRVPALELPIEVQFKVGITPTTELSSATQIVERSELKVVDDAAGEAMELFLNAITLGSID